jgi:hypothetical protein
MMCMNTQVDSTIWTHIVNSLKALEEISSSYLEGTLYPWISFLEKKKISYLLLKDEMDLIAL